VTWSFWKLQECPMRKKSCPTIEITKRWQEVPSHDSMLRKNIKLENNPQMKTKCKVA